MSSLTQRIGAALGIPFAGLREAGSQHGLRHLTGTLADGREVFVKAATNQGDEAAVAFAAEANGLRWLAGANGGPPVPQVIGVSAEFLVIELIGPQQNPSPDAARRLGEDLARMHAAGAPAFGAPWPGYIASLPLVNTPRDSTPLDNSPLDNSPRDNSPLDITQASHEEPDWAVWYAERRLLPYLRRARDERALPADETRPVEAVIARIGELAGPPEPPSRIHGDLWSGNVLWSAGRGWPIDPAAHGGHRETDLAMLALFGAPDLAEVLRGYTETVPLAEGWRARVPLHQLHPLLVHVCLFGLSYAPQLIATARAALASRPG
jgi:fructosamine-3-kinase